jgi:hypothetical protein
MQTFLVERDLAGISLADLNRTKVMAMREALAMYEAGDRVSYLGSTFLPEDGRCLCLFSAKSAEVVRQLNAAAMLPYDRIVPALELRP